MHKRFHIAFLTLVFLLLTPPVQAQAVASFSVGSIEAKAGSSNSGFLEIPSGTDAGTKIPISLIHGARPGPVLALIAGTHGYEYPGITALQRIGKSLDPLELAGTVILVHIANPPSFLGRTIYISPVDGKNLNRVYPGKINGTISERIAFAITKEVIQQADYLVDLHGGDGNEALRPYVYMPVTGNTELDSASRGMALAFGLDHIVIDEAPLAAKENSIYTDQTALSRGIPAITTETGQLGSNDDYWVDLAESGIWNLMRHLGMVEGEVIANNAVVWLSGYEVIRSPATGIFQSAVRDGYTIAANGLIGVLMDFFGNEITQIRAPFSGVVNYVLATPPVSLGEPIAMVSRIKED